MRAKGLTLIEVVASLVLMAGVVSALLLAQGRLLGQLRSIEEQELASDLAHELIAQWKLEPPTASQGEFEEHRGWSWARVEATTMLVRDPLVREVTLQITHRTIDGTEHMIARYQWLEKKDEERKTRR